MTEANDPTQSSFPTRWPIHHSGAQMHILTTADGLELNGLSVPWSQVEYMACTGKFAATVGLRNGTTWRLGFREPDVRADFAADCATRGNVATDVPPKRAPALRPSLRDSALDNLLATRVHIPGSIQAASRGQGSPVSGWRPAPPSVLATVLVSFFFGVFGLIPASMHARQAARAGYSGTKYWLALVCAWLASGPIWVLLIVAVAASAK